MHAFSAQDATLRYAVRGPESAPLTMVWAHGWGQSHASFLPLVQSFETRARHILLDLPGFGTAPAPPLHWGTADYAALIGAFLDTVPGRKLWVGHSFGCRIGVRVAAQHPERLAGLVLIAAPGLKRTLPLRIRIARTLRMRLFKTLKAMGRLGVGSEWLAQRLGSADYKAAGALRPVLVRTVNEDLSAPARQVSCPTLLIYGARDDQTPPEIGQRLAALIPCGRLEVLPGLDHYTVLGEGRHRVAALMADFINALEARGP